MGQIFTINDLENEIFFQLPQIFFNKNSKYSTMPLSCKVAYSIMHQKMRLSKMNGKADKETGEIYFFFCQEKLAEKLGIGRTAVSKIMKVLKENGLISTVHQGLGFPDKIYLHKLDPVQDDHIIHGRGEESEHLASPVNTSDVNQVNSSNSKGIIKEKREWKSTGNMTADKLIPSLEEVKIFFEKNFPEKNPQTLSLKFFDYYAAVGWRNGQGCLIRWQQVASRWGHAEQVMKSTPDPIRKTTSPEWWTPERQQEKNKEDIERLEKMRNGEIKY